MSTRPSDDELVSTLRSAADVGVPPMRRDVAGVLVVGRRARRRLVAARSTAVLTGMALAAFGGTALANAGPSGVTAASATEAAVADTDASDLPALPEGPADGVFDGTWQEYATAVASCLESQGWDIEPGLSEEGLNFEISNAGPGTDRALQASQEACSQSIGSKVEPERTDEELRALYDDIVAHYTCFQEAGFSDEQPPSFEGYLAMYRAGNVYADPMVGVAQGDYFKALKACPRSAPAE